MNKFLKVWSCSPLLLLLLSNLYAADNPGRPLPSRARPVQIYMMEPCAPCASLRKYMDARGYKLIVTETRRQPAGIRAFPTVYYRRGRNSFDDNGAAIYASRTALTTASISVLVWRSER